MTTRRAALEAERNERRKARYWILKGLGLTGREAARVSDTPARFAAALVKAGRDPDAYGELSRIRPGGHPSPRLATPKTRARSRRYWALRAIGASAHFANLYSTSDGAQAIGERRLRLLVTSRPR